MSILFMCYVSRVLYRFLHNARQPACHVACLPLKHGQADVCQPDTELADDSEQADVRCVNHGSAGYMSKIFQSQLLADTAEKTVYANNAFISRKFVSRCELPTVKRWRQGPRRGATISTLFCPSNEGTECYVNLKVQCRISQLPQANIPEMDLDTRPSQSQVRLVTVAPDEAGQRIDNFLARHLKGVPPSHVYRILRRGEVRVNSGRIRAQYKVQAGDRVRIPPVRVTPETAKSTPAKTLLAIEDHILFENAQLLVIDKPAGVAVHGGSGISHGIIEALRAVRPDAPYLELVHRLDRDTSGCLIVAKRRSALRALHEQLRAGTMNKRYLALLRGPWRGASRTVTAALRKNQLQGGERVVRIDEAGKEALTRFHPVSNHGPAILVDVELKTGRTHQIRVHAAHIGHPLAGDEKYGDAVFNRLMKRFGLRRLFLHAHRIEFTEPAGDRVVSVTAPLCQDLQLVLASLDHDNVTPHD
jgi:23S rRNA pseudouridine955/2504/2580 synthase